MDGSLIWVNYDGTFGSRAGKTYEGYNVITISFVSLQSIGGPAPHYASATATVSGSSTYKWQWTPPNNDTRNFPSPPLYVLADITGSCSCSGGVGLSGWGNISDGPHPAVSYTSTPGKASLGSNGLSRLLIHASGSPATLTLSPHENSKLSGISSGDTGVLRVDITESAFPVVLSAPNPFGRPDLGDGSNQFVYSGDTPDGYLYVPGALQAAGCASADANWLIGNSPIVGVGDKVDLRIEGNGTTSSAIPNTFTHQWAVSSRIVSSVFCKSWEHSGLWAMP